MRYKSLMILTVIFVCGTLTPSVQAQFGGFDPTRAIRPQDVIRDIDRAGRQFDSARLDIMDHNPRAGRDYTKIFVRNNTGRRIWAAVHWIPFHDPRSSTLSGIGSQWSTKAWISLAPGETVHAGNTSNTFVYFYATDKRTEWGNVKGLLLHLRFGNSTRDCRFYTAMILRNERYTFSFPEKRTEAKSPGPR